MATGHTIQVLFLSLIQTVLVRQSFQPKIGLLMTSCHSCVAVVALWLFSRWRTEIKKYVGEVFVCPAL